MTKTKLTLKNPVKLGKNGFLKELLNPFILHRQTKKGNSQIIQVEKIETRHFCFLKPRLIWSAQQKNGIDLSFKGCFEIFLIMLDLKNAFLEQVF